MNLLGWLGGIMEMGRRAAKQTDRDAKVRLLLRTAIETAQEAKQLLEEP